MQSNIIYPQGKATITIPAGEKIAVFTKDVAGVQQQLGYPNVPAQLDDVGTVENTMTVFGAYASGATIIVTAGAAPVLYAVGVAPTILEILSSEYQAAPVAVDVTGAVSATALLGGIVTSTTAAAVAGTIPTGTVMDAASEFAVGDSFDWSVINTGGVNAFTVTAAANHTIVGAAAVAASTSGHFRTRKTAANTFVTYRIA